MEKYSFEIKKKIVEVYLGGKGGRNYLATEYNVPASSNIKKWVDLYRAHGDEGLLCSRQNEKYTFEYKLHVVEFYLTSEVSYQELAVQEKINNPAQICIWVNDLRITGPDALRPKKKGRKKTLNSNNKNTNIKAISDARSCKRP